MMHHSPSGHWSAWLGTAGRLRIVALAISAVCLASDAAKGKTLLRAIRFEGTGYVELPELGSVLDLHQSFTIELWACWSASSKGQYFAGDEAWPGMHPELSVPKTSGWVLRTRAMAKREVLDFTIATTTQGWLSVLGPPQKHVDGWHHIAVVKTPDEIQLFLDGASIATTPCRNLAFESSPTNLYLGPRKFSGPNRQFQGAIHGFRLSSIARYQKPFRPRLRRRNDDATIIILLSGDLTPDGRLEDRSDNGYHGTIAGAVPMVLKLP